MTDTISMRRKDITNAPTDNAQHLLDLILESNNHENSINLLYDLFELAGVIQRIP